MIKGLAHLVAAAGLAALALGCDEAWNTRGPSTGGLIAAGATVNALNARNPRAAAAWAGVAEYGRAEAAREAAIAGRSTVVVNVSGGEGNSGDPEGMTRVGETRFLTCNYKDDLNGDGLTSLDEFVGIKKRFSSRESVMYAVCEPPSKRGAKILFILKNNRGEVIDSFESVTRADACTVWFKCPPGSLPTGVNRGSWYVDGAYAGSSDAEITEETERR